MARKAYTKEELKSLSKKAFTAEEWALLKAYFTTPSGCLSKGMTDADFLAKLNGKVKSLNLLQRAMNKIGLDEDELKEIPPIEIVGFNWEDSNAITSHTSNYCSKYTTSWLFFSDKEVYLYSYTLDMLSTSVKEICEEYFYKDIVNIGTSDESVEINFLKKRCIGSTNVKTSKNYAVVRLTVPGDKLVLPVSLNNSDFESKIRAAKAKIREKKTQ